jgi:hypothetical protein
VGIQIQRVELSGCGPLTGFQEELGPFTLVYARNERGKTTLVENLLAALFRDRRDGLYPALRKGLVGSARVMVAGLSPGIEVFTTAGRRRLEDLLGGKTAATGLPPALLQLLVVKGAESEIVRQRGGVTLGFLKSLLSSKRVYARVEKNLPGELGYTRLEDGVLVADRRTGAFKSFEETRDRLRSLEEAAGEFYATLSETERSSLERRRRLLVQQRERLHAARRHTAYTLSCRIAALEEEVDRVPEGRISELAEGVRERARLQEELRQGEEEGRRARSLEEKARWLEGARERYERCLARTVNRPQRVGLLLAAAFLLAALAAYFAAPVLLLPALALSAAGFTLALLATFLFPGGQTPEAARVELQRLREEFSRRFGAPLGSAAEFSVQKSALDRELGAVQTLLQELERKRLRLRELGATVRQALLAVDRKDAPEESWPALVQELRRSGAEQERHLERTRERLRGLGVEESDFLALDPGLEYSREREEQLANELRQLEEQLQLQSQQSESIRGRLSEHIGWEAARAGSLETVAGALEGRRQEYLCSMRESLATMIAGHVVAGALSELQREEDRAIEEALNRRGAAELLHRLTGRYDRLQILGEELYVGNDREAFPLAELSTGAREQVLLALRLGLARMLSGREGLFLVLDDAFQYSDWQRRDSLVEQAVEVVRAGWQVIYLTMDDDLRDRIRRAAAALPEGSFRLITLP